MNLGKKGIILSYSLPIPHEVKSGQRFMEGNLGTGTDAEATEGAVYWPAPHSLLCLLSFTTQDHLPMGGTADSKWGPPTRTINQENVPIDLPTGPSDGEYSQLRVPLPK